MFLYYTVIYHLSIENYHISCLSFSLWFILSRHTIAGNILRFGIDVSLCYAIIYHLSSTILQVFINFIVRLIHLDKNCFIW
jgi:hypothetical protein